MRFDPTLVVTRLVVERNEQVAYDELFHEGVNVVRGENSSGKSTILNFIFYGLGGDLADWSETALLCTRVIVEVRLNGNRATLSRQISKQAGQPMEIFGGDYETARTAPRTEWKHYPYRRAQSQESFSQTLFRLLGIPEVASDISGNVTMNQILRLLYADQLSPVENLFRFERFDQPALRDAVGRLLCGAYESAIYDNELQIRSLSREFDSVNAELRSLFMVLGKTEHSLTLDWINVQRQSLTQQFRSLQEQIESAEREVFTNAAADQLTLRAQEEAYTEVQRLQVDLGTKRQEYDALLLAITDSAAFIASLENKLAALDDSSAVAQQIGDVHFNVCPACYAPLDQEEHPANSCHLCKTPFDSERMRSRIVAMINDTAIQLKQSQLLQSNRQKKASGLNGELQALEEVWRRASQKLALSQRLPSTDSRERLRELHRQAGYLEKERENLEDKVRLIQLVSQLSSQKDDLNDRMNRLRTENEWLRISQQERLSRAYTSMADEIRTLLRNDLRRQDSFENPQSIEFDFEANKISVDGHSYFSASSRVILKSSFFLGFLAAATKNPDFRHPRFCMIDTVEDKGMEPERSHNFQNQILLVSQNAKVEHQIIYATSMISPDLDDEQYTIGKFSTRDDRTLSL